MAVFGGRSGRGDAGWWVRKKPGRQLHLHTLDWAVLSEGAGRLGDAGNAPINLALPLLASANTFAA